MRSSKHTIWFAAAAGGTLLAAGSLLWTSFPKDTWGVFLLAAIGCLIRGLVLESATQVRQLQESGIAVRIARQTFEQIETRFPNLSMRIHTEEHEVDLSMEISAQNGLGFDVHLDLQNLDELWLGVKSSFFVWFPCTKPEVVESYISTVGDVLEGRCRIVEHLRGSRLVKSEMQTPDGTAWKTIATCRSYGIPWPFQKQYRILQAGKVDGDSTAVERHGVAK